MIRYKFFNIAALSLFCLTSDTELALEPEQVFLDDEDYTRAPASPTTVPNVRTYRPPSTGMCLLKIYISIVNQLYIIIYIEMLRIF